MLVAKLSVSHRGSVAEIAVPVKPCLPANCCVYLGRSETFSTPRQCSTSVRSCQVQFPGFACRASGLVLFDRQLLLVLSLLN